MENLNQDQEKASVRFVPRQQFIGDSWWTQYEDLDTAEEQEYVKNYIKDVFPDTWRP